MGSVAHTPEVQARPPQQVEPSPQLWPGVRHGTTQTPPMQAVPEQQSALAAQVCASDRQAQRPPVQSIRPQHWAASVHELPASRQQSDALGVGRHEAPSQHCAAELQGDWIALQVGALRQTPSKQTRPLAQGLAPSQHAALSEPHVGPVSAMTGGTSSRTGGTSSRTGGTSSPAGGTSSPTGGTSSPGRTLPSSLVATGRSSVVEASPKPMELPLFPRAEQALTVSASTHNHCPRPRLVGIVVLLWPAAPLGLPPRYHGTPVEGINPGSPSPQGM